jgi:Na+/phosphate symporter
MTAVDTSIQLRAEVHAMCQHAVETMVLARKAFMARDATALDPGTALADERVRRQKALIEAAAGPPAPGLPADDPLRFAPIHLERVGDNIERVARAVSVLIAEATPFTERATREVTTLFDRAVELLECVRDVVMTANRVLARHVVQAGRAFEETADDFAFAHQARLVEGVCLPHASSLYLALLDDLKAVVWHARCIAERYPR